VILSSRKGPLVIFFVHDGSMIRRNAAPNPQRPFSRPVTRSFGGLSTARDTDMFYENTYIDPSYVSLPAEGLNDFREYIEGRKKEASASNTNVSQAGGTASVPADTRTTDRTWLIAVDSTDRNTVLYPDAAIARIFLGRTFENVARIELVSIEFPNADTTVSPRNNVIAWINEEDADIGYPVYKVSVPPRYYSAAENLARMMENMMNSSTVLRRGGRPGAMPHRFIVDLGVEAELVKITSIINKPTEQNPLSTEEGSNAVTVTQESHGLIDGDIVYVSGVITFVGGLAPDLLNGFFSVAVVDKDSFTIRVGTVATASARTGGGPWVTVGKSAPFKLLFGREANCIAPILGFPDEDSSELVSATGEGVLTSISLPSPASPMKTIKVIPGYPTQIVCPSHGLMAGDRIRFWNTFLMPNLYDDTNPQGEFDILSIRSPDVFTIDRETVRVEDDSQATVGTRLLQLTFPRITAGDIARDPAVYKRRFNRVSRIENAGPGSVRLTTLFPHGRKTGDVICLAETNSQPLLDGTYTVVAEADDALLIDTQVSVQRPGFRGILSSDHEFVLYGATAVGGFLAADLNDINFRVRDVIDENNIVFSAKSGFATTTTTGGGENLRISSRLHGFRGTQTNSISRDGLAFRPINLSGGTYCFLTVPTFGRYSTMLNTGTVKNILAKLLLTDAPGNFIFNSYVTAPLVFSDGAMQRLYDLDFQWVDSRGDQLTFSGMEWSCTLAVTCRVQVDDRNYQSSVVMLPRTGARVAV